MGKFFIFWTSLGAARLKNKDTSFCLIKSWPYTQVNLRVYSWTGLYNWANFSKILNQKDLLEKLPNFY